MDLKTSPYVFPGLSVSAKQQIKTHTCFNKGELDIIAAACCDQYDLTVTELCDSNRSAPLSDCRKMFFYLCREELYSFTCKRLGMYVGGRDHSTVVCAVRRCKELLEIDPVFRGKFKLARNTSMLRLKHNGYEYKGSLTLLDNGHGN